MNVNYCVAEILKLFIEEPRAQKMPFKCKSGASIGGKNKIFVKILNNNFSIHKNHVNGRFKVVINKGVLVNIKLWLNTFLRKKNTCLLISFSGALDKQTNKQIYKHVFH